jgi:hypothetical protein
MWAAFLAILDSLRELIPGLRRSRSAVKPVAEKEAPAVTRPSRLPSLTPTG